MNIKFISIILLSNIFFSQNTILPIPKIGLDSLEKLIPYPEIFRRAGFSNAYLLHVTVDESDNLKQTKISLINEKIYLNGKYYENKPHQLDSLAIREIDLILKDIEWTSGTIDDKKSELTLKIPIIFYSIPDNLKNTNPNIFIKTGIQPIIRKTQTY